mmetsp:Transcript_15718/g.32178  ORF Transcript_15718/g.32178 Transcript_15718/m.32178 type:complete len:779 (-) Transcript_15718:254-2590(-)
MKKSSRRSGCLRKILPVLVAMFAAMMLLECLPLSSASTAISSTTGTANKSSSSRKGFFGERLSPAKKETTDQEDGDDESASSDDDKEGEIAEPSNSNGDNDGEAAEKVTKTSQKTSWQFFYRKDETTVGEEEDADQPSSSSEGRDANNSRFRFGGRRRGGRGQEDELKEMFTTSDGDNQDKTKEGNETLVKDIEEENSENTQNDDDGEDDSAQHSDESSSSPSSSESKDDDQEKEDAGAETISEMNEENENNDEKEEEKETASKQGRNESQQDPMQQYVEQYQNAQRMQQQRLMGYPGAIIYRSPPSQHQQQLRPGMSPQDGHGHGLPTLAPGQAMAVAALVNLVTLGSRIFFVKWLIDKLAFESESKSPVQHFMWECLNDKFVKDDEIWNRVLSRAPQSMGIPQRRWGKMVKAMRPEKDRGQTKKKNQRNKSKNKDKQKGPKDDQLQVIDPTKDEQQQQPSSETSKTVVVMDFSTMNIPNPDFLRFADVVTFLVSSNSSRKQKFGPNPEVVLLVQSPGGEVTSFAFAAAQVARLRNAGWNVTVCVDRIAASGGYMIASQATQILASPFAMVGSVGVITETLNFYEILKQHGIQSLVLKAGDSKNPLTQFGEVTDKDIKTTQKDLDEMHKSFIDLCQSRRPTLDPAVCNGRILSGDMAINRGMIDRILTSDEYILEKIGEGDLVMKLHLVSGNSERNMIVNALQILPHLSSKFKRFMFAGGGENNNMKSVLAKISSRIDGRARMDGNFASKVVQIMGLSSMIRRAIVQSGFFSRVGQE